MPWMRSTVQKATQSFQKIKPNRLHETLDFFPKAVSECHINNDIFMCMCCAQDHEQREEKLDSRNLHRRN